MKPANIILDLLRTYRQRGTTVSDLTATGQLFGISENRIRVTLSRLVQRGIIEIVQRGQYRLRTATDPINEFAESWRLGEARVKPWGGTTWLCICHAYSTVERRKSEWALESFGFQRVATELWIRPDNLTIDPAALKSQLTTLGVANNAILMSHAVIEDQLGEKWRAHFDTATLDQRYQNMNRQLQDSLQQLHHLPLDIAKKESFKLGGEAIQILAKDPLLPETILDSKFRVKLWQTMCHYDEAGRKIWAGKNQPDTTPTSQLNFEAAATAKTIEATI